MRNTDRRRVRRSVPARALPVLVLAALAGCAASQRAESEPRPRGGEALSLEQSIERQRRKPDTRAMKAPPPPVLIDQVGGPLEGEALERARLPLDEAVWRIEQRVAQLADPVIPPAPIELTGADRLDAKRAYVEGRRLRLAEEYQRAENELRRAARLDPSSADVWREFGEVQLALGNLPLAQSAFRRAIDRDPDDVRSLDVLSRLMIDRREDLEAVPLLARMRRAPLADFDAALPLVVSARLGLALSRLGYDAAAAEAYAPSVDLPDQFGATTNYTQELSVIYRARGETARRLGDEALRRGAFEEAARMYALAARAPSADPSSLLARRVYTAMRAGQPADAAALLVERLREPVGIPERDAIDLLAFVVEHTESPAAVRRALDAERLAATDPAATGRLTRALAAISEPPRARELLLVQLDRFPADRPSLVALTERIGAGAPTEQARILADLTAESPADARLYATVFAAAHNGPGPALDAWAPTQDQPPASALLRAQLVSLAGRHADVEALLASAAPTDEVGAHALALRARTLTLLGRRSEAAALAPVGTAEPTEAERLARALVLDASGEHAGAADAIEPLIHSSGDDRGAVASRLLIASTLHENAGRLDSALALAQEAADLDTTREGAYRAVLRLLLPGAALTDEDGFAQSVRDLRDHLPESATMAWLRAQDAARRRQFELAEREARRFAEAEPERPDLLAALLTVWSAGSMLERGETWLREQHARWPGVPIVALALAEVLEARDDDAGALDVLEVQWESTPGDDDASRAFEAALRKDGLSSLRADEIAEARLADAPRTPDNLLDLIDLAVRRGSLLQAERWAREFTALPVPLNDGARQRLREIVVRVASAAIDERADAGEALMLVRTIVRGAPSVDPAAHFAHIQLLVSIRANLPDILESLEFAARHHPDRAVQIYRETAQSLDPRSVERPRGRAQFTRPRVALAVLEQGATTLGDEPPIEILVDWLIAVHPLFSQEPDAESTARLVALTDKSERTEQLVLKAAERFSAADMTREDVAAAFAFGLALSLEPEGPGDAPERMYRLALRMNPDHVDAGNNLGYRMLEENRDFEEAAALIERAYDAAMRDQRIVDNAHVIDSLGWSRYKLGVFTDELDADGKVVREGAVTILRRVYERVRNNGAQTHVAPVIIDHYADALWAAGEHAEAVEMWRHANTRAKSVMANLGDRDSERSRAIIEELGPVADKTDAKLKAVDEGRAPPIAPNIVTLRGGANGASPENAPAPAIID